MYMNTLAKKIGHLLALLCLSTSFLSANSSEENLVTPPGHYISSEEESQEQKEIFAAENSDEETQTQERFYRDPYYPIDYSSFAITIVGYQGNTITLSDGSLWTIRSYDARIAANWRDTYYNDGYGAATVYLTTNNDLFADNNYPYKMVNKQTNETVYCNISTTAALENCIWIQYIDYINGRIELAHANGFNVFHLYSSDFSEYINWQVGDRVFYGRNTRWNSTSNPYLIINFETASTARCDL